MLDPRRIAARYVRGYFVPDLVSVVPWVAQVALISMNAGETQERWLDALRLLRLARLNSLGTLGLEVWLVRKTGRPTVVFGARILLWFCFIVNLVACALIASAELYSGFCESWVQLIPDTLTLYYPGLDVSSASPRVPPPPAAVVPPPPPFLSPGSFLSGGAGGPSAVGAAAAPPPAPSPEPIVLEFEPSRAPPSMAASAAAAGDGGTTGGPPPPQAKAARRTAPPVARDTTDAVRGAFANGDVGRINVASRVRPSEECSVPTPLDIWIASVYFASAIITSTGFGDLHATNRLEMIIATLASFVVRFAQEPPCHRLQRACRRAEASSWSQGERRAESVPHNHHFRVRPPSRRGAFSSPPSQARW